MERFRPWLLLAVPVVCALARSGAAADPGQSAAGPENVVRRQEEVLVVSASKSEQALADAPATVSVISADAIAAAPSTNVGDLIRSVPGVNVIQMSARDVNVTSRQASSTLPNSQLALLDGRSIYLDFFGIILWDFLPEDPSEIKQIEVVRGPASAVWGANALTGVVNIITRAPRESLGTSLSLTGGIFSRDAGLSQGQGAGGRYGLSARYARPLGDHLAFKVSGGFSASDAWARPGGTVPLDVHPLVPGRTIGGGTFAAFPNKGTQQPKLDLRLDQDAAGGTFTYSAGYAGTQGIIHSGIGPFDIEPGSYMAYARVGFARGRFKAAAFVNDVDGRAPNLQTVDALSGKPIRMDFKTRSFDLELGHSLLIGHHHLLTYGGNVRRNLFDITIAPQARNRTELGVYGQEELFVGPFRLAAGARVDRFGSLDKIVASPRLMAMWRPREGHSLRVSFNKAFRAPAVLNDYLDLTVRGVDVPLGAVCLVEPALCAHDPTLATRSLGLGPRSVGAEIARQLAPGLGPLKEESVTAYELAYTGTVGSNLTLGAAYYVNDTRHNINFVGDPQLLMAVHLPAFYTSSYPPPGWPFPAALVDHPALRAALFDRLPATIAYLNIGPVRNQGLELSAEAVLAHGLRGSLSYSWQADPEALTPGPGEMACPPGELSLAAHHRLGAAVRWDRGRGFGSVSADYVGRAFWNDVLPQLGFEGFTPAYTLVNASLGLRWPAARGRQVVTVLKGTNLLDREIRQHIFGDIQKIGLVGEVRLTF